MRYTLWLFITLGLALLGIISFWPNYTENEFPLFTDILLIFVFIPCYFVFTFNLTAFLLKLTIKNKKLYRLF
ncbi:hypothetical protein, partial [Marinicrinis sediminis]